MGFYGPSNIAAFLTEVVRRGRSGGEEKEAAGSCGGRVTGGCGRVYRFPGSAASRTRQLRK